MPVDIDNIDVRGLPRGEIKRLRENGVAISTIPDLEEAARDEALDQFFAVACPELDADSITPGQALALYTRIIEKTYLHGGQEKNSDSPQS